MTQAVAGYGVRRRSCPASRDTRCQVEAGFGAFLSRAWPADFPVALLATPSWGSPLLQHKHPAPRYARTLLTAANDLSSVVTGTLLSPDPKPVPSWLIARMPPCHQLSSTRPWPPDDFVAGFRVTVCSLQVPNQALVFEQAASSIETRAALLVPSPQSNTAHLQ